MVNLTALTWIRFVIWMAIGFAVYAFYGYRHSVLGRRLAAEAGSTR
jgi:APA family basic amino acid/polyamine antiporter